MTSFILNLKIHPESNSDPMENSGCFIFVKMCDCLVLLGNTGKFNYPSIVDLSICPLGHFALIISVVGCNCFRWADTDMKFPVHHESATVEFSCSIYFILFVVGS